MKHDLEAFFKEYKDKNSAYDIALGTLSFDMATVAPTKGKAYRNKMFSILSGEAFSRMTDTESLAKIEALAKQSNLDETLQKELALYLRSLQDIRLLPKNEYIDFVRIIADSQTAWEQAKNTNDYAFFKPHLEKVIAKQKEVLNYFNSDKSDYDYLLDKYQFGMDSARYDTFFNTIKEELLPLIKKIQEKGHAIDDSILFESFDVTKQKAFMKELCAYLKVDSEECYIGISEHPFTEFFSAHETRITTHYYEHNVMSAILSTIHEYGHAKYILQVNEDYDGTSLKSEIGFAMHESQSRFMENHIARSKSFWKPIYPKLQSIFSEQLGSVSLDSFIKMINVTRPSFIRTEADELTYPIHVLIRYELEKEIMNGNVDFEQLNTLWNDKYEAYLGIRPKNDSEGILQDMHWGAGNIGYFPTYALGSAYAAQFYHQLQQDIDIDKLLEEGRFEDLYAWLRENIHQYGAFLSADEIIAKTTHEAFNVNYYISYLKQKYTTLYEL